MIIEHLLIVGLLAGTILSVFGIPRFPKRKPVHVRFIRRRRS